MIGEPQPNIKRSPAGSASIYTCSVGVPLRQVKTSLEENAKRSPVASDEQLRAAISWADAEGVDLHTFLDVVSPYNIDTRAGVGA